MNPLTDILQRCHERHKAPLRQRKTVAASTLYRGFPYCFTVYCAHRYPLTLDHLEQADISFMPIGHAPENDQGPSDFGGARFSERQRAASWKLQYYLASYGIQVYTGIPSERDGAQWHDIEFKYEALCAAPDAVLACVEALVNAVENPLLTLSKDGGLRFSCRIPDYLHPSDQASIQYIYKHNPSTEDPHHRDVYLEIVGEAGYSCWDARYEIIVGNLLEPPVIAKDVLFAPIDVLRRALHAESDLEPTPITEIENDTGIVPLLPPTNLPVSGTLLAIRDGTLSPLAIKRPIPILHKPEAPEAPDVEIPEKRPVQTQGVFDGDARIIGITTETGVATDYIEAYLRDGGTVCLNVADDRAAKEAVAHFQDAKVQIVAAPELFFNPESQDAALWEAETDRLYVVGTAKVSELFPVYRLSKDVLETWISDWQGCVLGDFARFLLNAIEIKGTPDSSAIRRIRAAVRAFASEADTLVEQMCQVPVCRNPNWTYWHQLKHFFDHYTRDADAPMAWEDETLVFWTPPILHPSIKRLLLTAANFSERLLRRAFPNDAIAVIPSQPAAWGAENRVFQIRTWNYTLETVVDYDKTWDVLRLSEIGERFFLGIRAEIERDPNIEHAIITYDGITPHLRSLAEKANVCLVADFYALNRFASTLEAADVLWIVGTPYWSQGDIWRRSQLLFGNDDIPLSYKKEDDLDVYSDARVQSVYEQHIVNHLTEIIGHAGLKLGADRKVVLITSFPLPGITDRPETLLFDWADFEIAGNLDTLPEVIATRERFEAERTALTADSSREEVERVLGCSSRQANRILKKFRGGRPLRVPFRDQILSQLSDGEKKTAALVAAIQGHPKAINNELTRLVEAGEIVKVRRGVYALP